MECLTSAFHLGDHRFQTEACLGKFVNHPWGDLRVMRSGDHTSLHQAGRGETSCRHMYGEGAPIERSLLVRVLKPYV